MPSQVRVSPDDLSEVPYFSLDLHRRSGTDVVGLLLTGDVDDATVGHLEDSLDWVVERMPQRLVVVDLSAVTGLRTCGVTSLRRVASTLAGRVAPCPCGAGSDEMHAALTAAGVLLAGRA